MKKCIKILSVIGFCIAALAAVTAGLYFHNEKENEKVHLTPYEFLSEDVPKAFDGYKIMVLSDFHRAPFGEQIISYAETIKPDIFVFLGDMVQLPDDNTDRVCRIGDALHEMEIPMYSVSGNHEMQGGSYEEIVSVMNYHHILNIDNDTVYLNEGKETLRLAGLKDPGDDEISDKQYKKIQKILDRIIPSDEDYFTVLLNHRADMYPKIKDCNADLILSGHMHGGVIRLPYIGGLIGHEVNEKRWTPEYTYGRIQEGSGAVMIVSGGCDINSLKKRVFNPPEVLLITLKSE